MIQFDYEIGNIKLNIVLIKKEPKRYGIIDITYTADHKVCLLQRKKSR